ncbi:hypothetical protein WJX73_001995 [Symbiochloris irregularis]|uniref:Desiccation-related protein PCC13-62 n=1 Tax=Symbiochloris irregularis TaxID=706552 RepID=A0AAW1PMS2_9CHLO
MMFTLKIIAVFFVVAVSANARSLQQSAPAPAGAPSATDILNFALNLEYLEAEFYSCAATGKPLSSSLRGSGAPASTGCQKANLTTVGKQLAQELMTNEVNHVTLLRNALGSAAVSAPQLNVGSAFSDVLNAALGTPASPAFSPYTNDVFFLLAAFMFEDVGVTAYEGAIDALKATPYLQTASRIAAVEAYQGGIVRSFLQSLVFQRTPTQVLDIVTLGKGANGGGFFPKGLNGGLTQVSLGGLGGSISAPAG